jgi:hypothetical protein
MELPILISGRRTRLISIVLAFITLKLLAFVPPNTLMSFSRIVLKTDAPVGSGQSFAYEHR